MHFPFKTLNTTLAVLLSCFCMWYDAEEWAKASRFSIVLNIGLIQLHILLWILVAIRRYRDFDMLSPSRIAEYLGMIVGGVTAYLAFVQPVVERSAISKDILSVDRPSLAVPTGSPSLQKHWQETRSINKTEGKLMLAFIAGGVILGVPQFLFVVVTETLFYHSVVKISDESYSWPWWLQCVYQGGTMLYAGFFCGVTIFIPWNMFYQIQRLFKVQADAILELCEEKNFDPKEENTKLRAALKEILELYEISAEMKRLLKENLILLGTVSFMVFSSSGIAIIFESKNGWLSAISKSIALPVCVSSLVMLWALIAENSLRA